MLSLDDLESLISEKRREIESEKMLLGLSHPNNEKIECKENDISKKQVNNTGDQSGAERDGDRIKEDDMIPADLERYIRRYIGLPGMLKAGEYSPNNPLIKAERCSGDALLALGEYERRRNTLRKYQQKQYREYLDQQAKKKQEAKELAENERREREQKEREYEERQRQREQERVREKERATSPEIRRPSLNYNFYNGSSNSYIGKVDTGVQVDAIVRPLSVAVQTDHTELFQVSPSKSALTIAERELSPRTVTHNENLHKEARDDDRPIRKTNREKLVSDLRHTYMPSILDADVIQHRNIQVEKEAAEKRQCYQQELKNQIHEQQRIKEERRNREKMLELAEMRRLEEQLRMLKVAQEKEVHKHHDMTAQIKESASEFYKERTSLQKDIEIEQQNLLRAKNPSRPIITNPSSKSDLKTHYFPKFYKTNDQKTHPGTNNTKDTSFIGTQKTLDSSKKPFSTNISDSSIFSPNYDVDGYLRRNLNPKENYRLNTISSESSGEDKRVVIEKALIHELPSESDSIHERTKKYEPSFMKKDEVIPVLRHSPKPVGVCSKNDVSDKMRVVEDKWKVPVVQKNILRSLPNESGDNVSILTQLGSIRRQLQLEQLKLDNMISGNDA